MLPDQKDSQLFRQALNVGADQPLLEVDSQSLAAAEQDLRARIANAERELDMPPALTTAVSRPIAPVPTSRNFLKLFRMRALVLGIATAVLCFAAISYKSDFGEHAQREYITGAGERVTIQLSDGSSVILGANSKLKYSSAFGDKARNVYMEGIVHFDIVHSATAPFIVYTANAATQVLGTAFTVTAYPNDTLVQVAVANGKVALRSRAGAMGTGTTLVGGDVGRLTTAGLASVARGVDMNTYANWIGGKLTFRRTMLKDVVQNLEHWYNIKIILPDSSYSSIPISGSINSQSAEQAISRLAEVLDVEHSRDGRVVTLSKSRR